MHFHNFLKIAAVLSMPQTVLADTTTTIGARDGWGTSLAWWAKQFGNRDDFADALFTLKQTQVNGQILPGLGFNIVRYNVGASSWKAIGSDSMVQSITIKKSR
jgi:galactan endo-1,6-beta-galactosidase